MWCTDLTDSAETWVTWENDELVMSLIWQIASVFKDLSFKPSFKTNHLFIH